MRAVLGHGLSPRKPGSVSRFSPSPSVHPKGCTPDDEANMSLILPPDNLTKPQASPEPRGIPTPPGHIMPRRMDLGAGYKRPLVEIEHNRRRQLRADNYAQEVRHGAFSAFLRALRH